MISLIFYWIGVVVCIASGLVVTGLLLVAATNFVWGKLQDIHSLATIMKIIRENKVGGSK